MGRKPTKLKKEIIKPVPEVKSYLNYFKVRDWIEFKLGKSIDNYAGKIFKTGEDDVPFLSFWQSYMLERNEITNGCFATISFDEEDIEREEDWVKEILLTIKSEFEEYVEGDELEVWVSW